jgi:hypothetical protein
MAIVPKAAIAAVLFAAIVAPAPAADVRYHGVLKRHAGQRYVYKRYADTFYVLTRGPCEGGFVYAGPFADRCAFAQPVVYARDPDPYYRGWYGPRLRYRYAPATVGY